MVGLTENGFKLLRECVTKHNPSLLPSIESDDNSTYTADFYNELRDIVGSEFCDKGLQPNSEPNAYGLELENLIDEIGRLFM